MTDPFLSDPSVYEFAPTAPGPKGKLPLTDDLLRHAPSGDLFGWTQNVGMGLNPSLLGRKEFLILSTHGGLRAEDGSPIALGYHSGHWEVGLLVKAAAEEFQRQQAIPFAGAVRQITVRLFFRLLGRGHGGGHGEEEEGEQAHGSTPGVRGWRTG